MSDATNKTRVDIKVDLGNLYCEETFTDLKLGWIRRLTPVKPDGSKDENREYIFIGQTQLVTPEGPVPVHCRIPEKTLEEAIEQFPQVMEQTMHDMIKKAMERQEQAASSTPAPESNPKE
jgi:hypothetical protein